MWRLAAGIALLGSAFVDWATVVTQHGESFPIDAADLRMTALVGEAVGPDVMNSMPVKLVLLLAGLIVVAVLFGRSRSALYVSRCVGGLTILLVVVIGIQIALGNVAFEWPAIRIVGRVSLGTNPGPWMALAAGAILLFEEQGR